MLLDLSTVLPDNTLRTSGKLQYQFRLWDVYFAQILLLKILCWFHQNISNHVAFLLDYKAKSITAWSIAYPFMWCYIAYCWWFGYFVTSVKHNDSLLNLLIIRMIWNGQNPPGSIAYHHERPSWRKSFYDVMITTGASVATMQCRGFL